MLYEIIIGGYFPETWFEGFTISKLPNFTTKLRGNVVDQAVLYGVLRSIHDLGIELISVTRIKEES